MKRILPGIHSLVQHLKQLRDNLEAYRPDCCPHCSKGGLHHHGYYGRNTPRGEGLAFSLEFIPIPRFYCPGCRRTCSRLPACTPPRRHYWWTSQQAVLTILLAGVSIYKAALRLWPSRHTIRRWWRRMEEQFDQHGFYLRNRFSELGRHNSLASFWSACFRQMLLADAMVILDQEGVVVP